MIDIVKYEGKHSAPINRKSNLKVEGQVIHEIDDFCQLINVQATRTTPYNVIQF